MIFIRQNRYFLKTFTIHKGIFQQEIWEATEAGEYKLIIYDKDDENAEFVLSKLYFYCPSA